MIVSVGSILLGLLVAQLKPNAGAVAADACESGWLPASWTYYYSYAPCCPDSPNYDPNADTDECVNYSACDYTGEFAYLDGKQSFEFVASNNLVSFFTTNGDNKSYGGKSLLISAMGKTIEALVADTCSDRDCDGCCTENAMPSGNLIDMEAYTVINNFGDLSAADGQICWKLVDSSTPPPVAPSCGVFGLDLFCPLTSCGWLGRLLGLCKP